MAEYSLAVSDQEVQRYMFMAKVAEATEADLWQAAGIVPGAVVADVGCGPGAVAVVMANLVGASGRVIGVDQDEKALAAARVLVERAAAHNVELRRATATKSSVEPGSVDVVVMRHVLGHNGEIEQQIVDHLATLVKPGGHVYLVDILGPAMRAVGADPDLNDLLPAYAEFHRRRGNDLEAGVRLSQLLTRAGLSTTIHQGFSSITPAPPTLRPHAWAAREAMLADGVITTDDITRWEAAFKRTDALTQRPTMFGATFIAIGERRTNE